MLVGCIMGQPETGGHRLIMALKLKISNYFCIKLTKNKFKKLFTQPKKHYF